MALEDIYKSLTDEQKKMAEKCKTPEEMLALTKELGIKLNDDELEAVAGGKAWYEGEKCPFCPNDSSAWS